MTFLCSIDDCPNEHHALGLCNRHYMRQWQQRLRDEASATPPVLTKERAACCVAKRDEDGRLPIGLCGPDCIRRVARDTARHTHAGRVDQSA